MKILRTLPHSLFIFCLALSLTACSQQGKQSALKSSPPAPIAAATDAQGSAEENSSALEEPEPEETAQEEIAAMEQPGAWEFGGSSDQSSLPIETGIDLSAYDFPITINKQVLYYLDLFQGKQRKNFSAWLARSNRYRPFIEKELQKAGLPQDLVFLAMIESGFNPSAYSCADASGLWQFIEGTGRIYGLKIDSYVDERREPEKATKAAIKFLSKLHAELGDWYLAVAAYNAGEKTIENAINNYGSRDFWKLAVSEGLHMETKRYVPKLIAAIMIARNPEQYGFSAIGQFKPIPYDTIEVPAGTDLEAVAVTANTSVKELRTLNNELLKNQAPSNQDSYALKIPAGTRELVAKNIDKLYPVATTKFITHTVKKGETIFTICDLYNVSKINLLKANRLQAASLKQGLRLQVPVSSTQYVLFKNNEKPETRLAQQGGNKQMILHQMKPGDSLSKIAKQYDLPLQSIMRWNKITDQRKVKKGQQLALYLDRPAPEAMTVLTGVAKETISAKIDTKPAEPLAISKKTEQVATPLLADGKKQAPSAATPTLSKPTPVVTVKKNPEAAAVWYVVKKGDNLWNIANKFKVPAPDLKKQNQLRTNDLAVGSKLLIKKA